MIEIFWRNTYRTKTEGCLRAHGLTWAEQAKKYQIPILWAVTKLWKHAGFVLWSLKWILQIYWLPKEVKWWYVSRWWSICSSWKCSCYQWWIYSKLVHGLDINNNSSTYNKSEWAVWFSSLMHLTLNWFWNHLL